MTHVNASTPDRNALVSLVKIAKETVQPITELKVNKAQSHCVAPNAVSIAQAYFERDKAWFCAIYAAETPVSILILHDDPAIAEHFL